MTPSRIRSIRAFLIVFALLGASSAWAQVTTSTLSSPPSTGTLALLDALEKKHGGDKTVYAEFSQVRHDESMDEDISSTGSLWFKRNPDKFRCDYANPQPMITIMTDQKIYLYTKEFNQVDFYQFETPEEFAQNMDTLLLGFGFKATDLVRRYDIQSSEDEGAALAELKKAGLDQARRALMIFTPKPAFQEQSQFTALKVFIDKATYLPEKIWYQDPQGNTMRIQLKKIERDVKVEDNLFSPRFVFPADAKYIDKKDTQ